MRHAGLAPRAAALLLLASAVACASPPPPRAPAPRGASGEASGSSHGASGQASGSSRSASLGRTSPSRAAVVEAALDMIGAPYRYGGRSPRGVDCSGLVVYSFGRAGIAGLPHSVAALAHRARPVSLAQIEPGDLLFFDLEEKDGKKGASHVAIYVGDRTFVHAPSSGKRVEAVSFDHVYWSRHLGRAGSILH
jgi:cell wall-associated NlpC family hydrolase